MTTQPNAMIQYASDDCIKVDSELRPARLPRERWYCLGASTSGVGAPIMFGGIVFAICCLFTVPQIQAQDEYRRLEPPRKKSAIESLSALHRKVKQNLFGHKRNSDSEPSEYARRDSEQYASRPAHSAGERSRPHQNSQYSRDQYPRQRHTRYNQNQPPTHRASHVQYEQPLDAELRRSRLERRNEYPPQNYNQGSFELDPPARNDQLRSSNAHEDQQLSSPPPLNSYNGYERESQLAGDRAPRSYDRQDNYANTQERYESLSRSPLQGSEQEFENPTYAQPGQNMLRNPPAPVSANVDYRTGHYQNGNGIPQQQFNQQLTATQRAIKLQEENQTLQSARQAGAAENQRLMRQLQEKNQLLQEIAKAIEAARSELQKANQDNESLKSQIAQLESEKTNQLLSSKRQLDAIRKKLDDVLMNEISR